MGKKTFSKNCTWQSQPDFYLHDDFLRSVVETCLKDAIYEGTDRKNKVLEWKHPNELKAVFDFQLRQEGVCHDKLLNLLKDVIKYSVKTGHPLFMNQLFSGLDPYGLAGQWVTDALNASVYTYEVSPVFSLMEEEVISKMASCVGYTQHDGLLAPGGSISNLYAVMLARHHRMPEVKKHGVGHLGNMVIFTSEDAHYSIVKSAVTLGIGSDNVKLIPVDIDGRMDVSILERSIDDSQKEGCLPLMVIATAGTTVLGAYDPINKIANICNERNIWLHVDAAWGGGALLSSTHKHKLVGIERADSVTWNPHKMMAVPQQCSVLLTKHKDLLKMANSANASYLFQKDKFYDTSYDSGDKHIQCGRRADVVKVWTMWKAKGSTGFEKHIDRVFELTQYVANEIKARRNFKLLCYPDCANICFWFIPPSFEHLKETKDYYEKLHKVAPSIKEHMMTTGQAMITYQPLRNLPNFFRLVLQNSGVTENDLAKVLDIIEECGRQLTDKHEVTVKHSTFIM